MKSIITLALFALAAPTFAQNTGPATDTTMAAEQGAKVGAMAAPSAHTDQHGETAADPNAPSPSASNQEPAPVPPQVLSAADAATAKGKEYPACTRRVRDNCRNAEGK